MIIITIQRHNKNKVCTSGAFKAISTEKIGIVNGYTLEPPDIRNGLADTEQPSCIKPDTYKAQLYESPSFHTTVVLLENKHGREWIEIHPGNYPRNTKGCILVGTRQGKNVVWESRKKLAELIGFIKTDIKLTGDEKFNVIVKDVV